MLTPISWLERVPTYKEMREQLQEKDLSTYGFLGYPVLQTADVALYQAQWVPVGQDQVVHIELSREILRRFNFLYGTTFTEPQPLLTLAPKLLGTDGRKMSKSYHNSIYLTDPLLEVEKKVLGMVTDPARKRRTDPGNPEICPVFDYHKIYTSENERNTIVDGCQTASMGCVDCKKNLLKTLVPALADHQTRRQSFEKDPLTLKSILKSGVEKASAIAEQSLNKVRQKMNLL